MELNGEIKNFTEENGTINFEGMLVTFDKVDLQNDLFSNETDFDLDENKKSVSIYYDHGLNKSIGKRKLGSGIVTKQDVGLWFNGQIKIADEYDRAIADLIKLGKLKLSSGTANHLVERKKVEGGSLITKWPIGLDASLTPTPAEYSNVVSYIKSFGKVEITMSDEIKKEIKDEVVDSENQQSIKSLMDRVDALTKRIEDLPTKSIAGYVSETGGNTDKNVKSFGDFLLAVKRQDFRRIHTVYGTKSASELKDMQIDVGTTGGFLVPKEMSTTLMQMAYTASKLMQKVTRIPVSVNSGTIPSLDYTVAPTAGSGETGMAANITSAITAPGGAATETTPKIDQINWVVNKVSGFTQVQKELSADSPVAIEALLKTLFGIAIASKNERNILRGSGVGEPLGILNATSLVNVTPNTNNSFTYTDATTMLSRLKVLNRDSVMWLYHPSVLPDIGALNNGTFGVFQQNTQAQLGQTILGYQMEQSEHLPQADASGDVLLVDASAYLFIEREELIIDFSPHYAFINGLDTWMFYQRNDGMPWLKNVLTLASPGSAFTQSCFVNHND